MQCCTVYNAMHGAVYYHSLCPVLCISTQRALPCLVFNHENPHWIQLQWTFQFDLSQRTEFKHKLRKMLFINCIMYNWFEMFHWFEFGGIKRLPNISQALLRMFQDACHSNSLVQKHYYVTFGQIYIPQQICKTGRQSAWSAVLVTVGQGHVYSWLQGEGHVEIM